MRRNASFLEGLTAQKYLQVAAFALLILMCANLLFCTLRFEFGYAPIDIMGTGPLGANDRFGDLVKDALSYRSFTSGIKLQAFNSWPDIFKYYYVSADYGGIEALAAGRLTHFHQPPLTTLFFIANAAFIVFTQSPQLDIFLAWLLYLAAVQWTIWVGIPREKRSGSLLLAVWSIALFSYPALSVVTRGNFTSGFTSLFITAYLLSLFVRKKAGLAALLSLALAVNIRPNAGIFVFALPLALGFKPSLKPILQFAALAAGILGASCLVAHALYPDYTVQAFLQGLEIYKQYFIVGHSGDGANSSLFALFRDYGQFSLACPRPVLLVTLLILELAIVSLGVRRASNWILVAPLSLPVLYAIFVSFLSAAPDTLVVNTIASALVAAMACLGLWRSRNRLLIAPLVLTALYCLLCPIFSDYHLLVFLAPLLIAFFGDWERPQNHRVLFAIGAICVLILSPKNYLFVGGLSVQAVVNPLLLYAGVLFVIAETLGVPEAAPAPGRLASPLVLGATTPYRNEE